MSTLFAFLTVASFLISPSNSWLWGKNTPESNPCEPDSLPDFQLNEFEIFQFCNGLYVYGDSFYIDSLHFFRFF